MDSPSSVPPPAPPPAGTASRPPARTPQLRGDFEFSDHDEPHAERTRAILRDHPEVRELIGRNPWSALVVVAGVGLQLGVAWAVRDASWWVIAATGYLFGAFVNHAMYVMIHEATHNLIFAKRSWNQAIGILADIPNVVPASISFRIYHLKHHAHQGDYELDADLPSRWEARLMGGWSLGKALWLLGFPIFQILRPPRLREIRFLTVATLLNWAVVIAAFLLIFFFWGGKSGGYLFLSFLFSIGLHPLGARWIQEHYLTNSPQETYSYYGILNLPAFNVGYHNEHHDFPSIPWNRLPRLKAIAPGYYDSLVAYRSWTALLLRWIFDRELTLFSRMIRRGKRTARRAA